MHTSLEPCPAPPSLSNYTRHHALFLSCECLQIAALLNRRSSALRTASKSPPKIIKKPIKKAKQTYLGIFPCTSARLRDITTIANVLHKLSKCFRYRSIILFSPFFCTHSTSPDTNIARHCEPSLYFITNKPYL